ncbi:hypothetical protein [Listeria booriae]|uniref:hypothetical protein n=1 Tax=Listeria booriae TaxID=1552123 RepID=UPI0016272836|nr:hypothetical protein [Listeria booriae]MBC2023296.1 hypothetical protein [Listeria booriae]
MATRYEKLMDELTNEQQEAIHLLLEQMEYSMEIISNELNGVSHRLSEYYLVKENGEVILELISEGFFTPNAKLVEGGGCIIPLDVNPALRKGTKAYQSEHCECPLCN